MEVTYSDSLMLAWQVANTEAKRLAAAFLEPAHLLLGLCKCVDIDLASSLPAEMANREKLLEELVREFERLATVFKIAGFDARRFRRHYRTVLPEGSAGLNPAAARLHRSGPARDVLREAEGIAKRSGSVVYPIHLLSALLTEPDPQRDMAMLQVGADQTRLRRTIERHLSHQAAADFTPPGLPSPSWN